jgi:hypothetical protein
MTLTAMDVVGGWFIRFCLEINGPRPDRAGFCMKHFGHNPQVHKKEWTRKHASIPDLLWYCHHKAPWQRALPDGPAQ